MDTLSKDGVVLGSNRELTASEAERWYNAVNPPSVTVRAMNPTDEIQTKPKWAAAIESRRGNFEVVETPLLVKGSVIFLDPETKKRVNPEKDLDKIRNLARMVVIKNLKTGEMCHFIMIFVGTYDYLMKSNTLLKNSYLHRESDFEGSVYFYKPGHQLVNGWKYKAGKIVAAISPGLGDNITTRAGRPEESCITVDVAWVEEWRCWNEEYDDSEFGRWMSAVCKKSSTPVAAQVCDDGGGGETEPGPWDGGTSGGYDPPTKPDDKQNPKDPCDKEKALSADVAFKSRVWDLFSQLKTESVEDGWILSTAGEIIRPSVKTATSIKYGSEQIEGKSFVEWYHLHPESGAGMASYGDLNALALRYQRGHITNEGFTYGVVSVYGCLSMMIVSPADFSKFAELIVDKSIKSSWESQVEIPNTESGTSFEQRMGRFLDFLQVKNSGLKVMFRSMDKNNAGNWKPQEIDTNKKMKDEDCN